MNFKESYKKANDEITGDSALLEKILSTPKKEKTKITPFVYKTASCAAAFVLIVTLAFMPKIKDKFVTEDSYAPESEEYAFEPSEDAVMEETEGIFYDVADADDEVDEFSFDMTGDYEETKKADYETAPDSEMVEAFEITTANEMNDEIAAYSGEEEDGYDSNENDIALTSEMTAEPVEESIKEDDTQSIAEEAPKTEITASGGGGGAPAVTKNTKSRAKAYTANDVLAHIGINYESLALDGMVLTEDNVLAEFSEDETISFYYIDIALSDGDKHMDIILTDSVSPLAYDISEVEGGITAHKTVGNTDIFITAQNMTKDEVETYINKIA